MTRLLMLALIACIAWVVMSAMRVEERDPSVLWVSSTMERVR